MDVERRKELFGDIVQPLVSATDRVGLTPNQVSVFAFLLAVAAASAFYLGSTSGYLAGVTLMLASGVFDVVDGELARYNDVASPQGDMLDHTLDRFSDVALIAGVAGGLDAWMLGTFAVAGVLLTSYMGTQAQAVGAGRDYGGVMGRGDRFAVLVAGGVLHPFVPPVEGYTVLEGVLVLFAVVGTLTAVQRFLASWRALEE